MPTYKMRCASCKKEFSITCKIDDRHSQECVKCREKLKVVPSTTGFSLKGRGWYRDGY